MDYKHFFRYSKFFALVNLDMKSLFCVIISDKKRQSTKLSLFQDNKRREKNQKEEFFEFAQRIAFLSSQLARARF
jgi:hypothetical protein